MIVIFVATFAEWRYELDKLLLRYCALTLAELPKVHPALLTWYGGGASAFKVAQCIAAFMEGE